MRAVTSKALGPTLGMYSHGVVAPGGEIVVVAGQVGIDRAGRLHGPGDVVAQTKQTFENIRAVLEAAGSGMAQVVRLQTFLTHAADIEGFMRARREVFPRYFPDGVYPPNTLLVVSRLVQPELLVEVEAMAVKPEAGREPRRPSTARKAAKRTGAMKRTGRRQTSRRRR
ncbi:MAG TPA: RidA family protein [Candidatus Dormibacteraeota bacterium]|nr:RidA family protein [Candidatus Dormibacteraeota bacterium]